MNKPNLPNSSIVELSELLKTSSKFYEKLIKHQINEFITEHKSYSLFEISDSIILVIRRDSKPFGMFIDVGFPFPIYTEKLGGNKILERNKVSLHIHLRGEPLRERQRVMLKEVLGSHNKNFLWVSVKEVEKFRNISRSILNKNKKLAYVDPYTFLGDSIIGLYFLDKFREIFSIKDFVIFSIAHRHIKAIYDVHPRDTEDFGKLSDIYRLVIMPDLIDTHWSKTLEFLHKIKDKKGIYVFLVGRNIIIELGKKNIVYQYENPDPLLRNKNIEDYMDDCLSSFLEINLRYRNLKLNKIKSGNKRTIFINPLSSFYLKDLPVNITFLICERLVKEFDCLVYVATGVRTNPKDINWVNTFSKKLFNFKDDDVKKGIKLLNADSLTELAMKILHLRVSASLTVDTSVAHLLTQMSIPHITIFNKIFWDSESIQSLVSDSPLGFCRYNFFQYPAILHENENINKFCNNLLLGIKSLTKLNNNNLESLSKNVLEFIHNIERLENFKNGVHKSDFSEIKKSLVKEFSELKRMYDNGELCWVFEIYNPLELTEGILQRFPAKKTKYIFSSSWLIAPVYKYFRTLMEIGKV